ncbi:MAG: P1 family peptidase, partial [Pseudomonadota bacterium]
QVKHLLAASPDNVQEGWNGEQIFAPEMKNTTISLVVTNRRLHMSELQRIAVQVHTSMGRAIQPFATEMDGDVLYAVTTDEVETGPGAFLPSYEIGLVASELMWDAILAAVPEQPRAPAPSVNGDETLADGDTLDRFTGDYVFSRFATLSISRRRDGLYARATGERDVFAIPKDKAVALTPVASNRYTLPDQRYPFEIVFENDSVVLNPGRWEQRAQRAPTSK